MKDKIKELLKIVNELNEMHPKKKFTLDGRLVGDIGEVMAEEIYQIDLYNKVVPKHDAETLYDKKKVQIKTTMKGSIDYPRDHHPKLLLPIEITKEGEVIELYNGETSPFINYLKTRKKNPSYNYYTITKGILKELNKKVKESTRIKKRLSKRN